MTTSNHSNGTTAPQPPKLHVVRLDHIQQAAADWQEGLELTRTIHQELGATLARLEAVTVPAAECNPAAPADDPRQGILNAHHRLLEAVALLVESVARYHAAAPEAPNV
jgi:hypothetical protein